jgi:hypothetical protein
MSGKMADMLNQFMPYTVLAIIKESDASESELNIPLSLLFNPLILHVLPNSSLCYFYTLNSSTNHINDELSTYGTVSPNQIERFSLKPVISKYR